MGKELPSTMIRSGVLPLWKNMGNSPLWGLFKSPRGIFKKDELGLEIAQIALPAALALTADPIASLVDTAFIGHIEMTGGMGTKRHISSASSALLIGGALGLIQAVILICTAKPLLSYMGVKSDSPMLKPALKYLTLRSLGAPAVLLSLAMQGVFRGFKDTKTPLYATRLLLLFRVIAATFCVTLAASLAAKLGSTSMAAFQICLQVWLATSLLADGLAVAGQAILANAFARNDYEEVMATASRVLQLSLALGLVLCIVVAIILQFSSRLFTDDINVLRLLQLGIPVLIAIFTIICLFLLYSSNTFVGIWLALSIFMSLRALVGFLRIGTRTGPWSFLRG
ncbi:UNVERIFIED_CONTAM: protein DETOXIFICATION 42 [Sesamum radiatum]|uniref:Protein DETOXIFICATION 42 n=1 Tax=Sesamum radiatum TaxID=300843 RepID=A0AAW2N9C5_SESRA